MMSKTRKQKKPLSGKTLCQQASNNLPVETGRRVIKDNYLAALVTSKVFRTQVVQAKKGKGAYQRKEKHQDKGQESYLIAA